MKALNRNIYVTSEKILSFSIFGYIFIDQRVITAIKWMDAVIRCQMTS